jgi:hypothetical protein
MSAKELVWGRLRGPQTSLRAERGNPVRAKRAKQKKRSSCSDLSVYFARLPARGWIAFAYALWATADKSLRLARRSSKSEVGSQ